MPWESFKSPCPRRFHRLIIGENLHVGPHPRPWLGDFRFMVVSGFVALPQAVAISDDPGKAGEATAGAASATISGRVTDQARVPLADVRVSVVAVGDPETRTVNAGAQSRQLVARSDARGDYRLEVPGITKRAIIVIDAFKPGYRSLRGPLMSAGDTKRFEVVPGSHEKADLVLKPALYFAGMVVDEQGKPIPGVSIRAYANGPRLGECRGHREPIGWVVRAL